MANKATWARSYLAALQQHLQRGAGSGAASAQALGRQAVALGLDTMDVMKLHERAVARLVRPARAGDGHASQARRAEQFFAMMVTPIEQTHRAARSSRIRINRLNQVLARRTRTLATSRWRLQRGIRQRVAAEKASQQSGRRHVELLKKARILQDRLRRLTRRLLVAQEEKRRKISRDLHDDIAQMLVGIQVRLLTTKVETTVNAAGLKNDMANMQRLVVKSMRILRRFVQ